MRAGARLPGASTMTPSFPRTSTRRTVHRLVTLLPPALFGLAAALTLAGCPVGADLEDPERFAVGGTGGTTAASGGTAGSGTSGSGGTAGSGLGTPDPGCDYVTVLNSNCARTACHNTRSKISGLDLTPDANLAARLKDVPATHGDIDCSNGGVFMACVPESCASFGDAPLVDSANPDNSWILHKLNATHNDCGLEMPIPPGDTGFDATRLDCLDKLVRAIAAL